MNVRKLVENNLRALESWKNTDDYMFQDVIDTIVDAMDEHPIEYYNHKFENEGFSYPCMDGIAF